MSEGVTCRGNNTVATRCNPHSSFIFVLATHLISCPNFSFINECLTNLWDQIGTQGYLSEGVTSRGNITLATRCNIRSCFIFVLATHLISCPNFSFINECLTNLWDQIGAQGYLNVGVTSRGNITLATRCNIRSCFIFVLATHLISCPNFSFIDECLTNLWDQIGAQGYLSEGGHIKG